MNTDFTPEELEHYNAVNQAKHNMARDALAVEVAKLVAQGYKIQKENSNSARLIPAFGATLAKASPLKKAIFAAWVLVNLPIFVLAGFIIPFFGWGIWLFVIFIGAMVIVAVGKPPKTVSIQPDGQVKIA